ncbi:MAG: hypothetical protein ACK559_22355, partial [bacterium]
MRNARRQREAGVGAHEEHEAEHGVGAHADADGLTPRRAVLDVEALREEMRLRGQGHAHEERHKPDLGGAPEQRRAGRDGARRRKVCPQAPIRPGPEPGAEQHERDDQHDGALQRVGQRVRPRTAEAGVAEDEDHDADHG